MWYIFQQKNNTNTHVNATVTEWLVPCRIVFVLFLSVWTCTHRHARRVPLKTTGSSQETTNAFGSDWVPYTHSFPSIPLNALQLTTCL